MEQIVGHENVKCMLKKIIEEEKIGHAYMFLGKEGIGKKLVAIEFAKQIMNVGESTFNEADFQIVSPDNDVIKVEAIRNLINDVYLKPAYSKHKVIIIDDAEKMNANAQNALLKVLEEPPIYATIILIVSNKEKILKTILSRVTEITFQGLTNDELKKIVGQEMDIEIARGSASKALSILEGKEYSYANELMQVISNNDFLILNKKMNEIKQADIDIVKVLELLKIMYYENLQEDTYSKVKNIEFIDYTIKNLNRNANTDLALDKLMIQFTSLS